MVTVLEFTTMQTTQLCISGEGCGRQFCICDLAKIIARNYLDIPQFVCKDCFNRLKLSYENFAQRIIRSDFFQEYLAARLAAMLQNTRTRVDKSGCGCGRADCKITKLTPHQRDDINNKFIALCAAFSFCTCPTDTRCDKLRWLGRNM
jgi:hypothetical protein